MRNSVKRIWLTAALTGGIIFVSGQKMKTEMDSVSYILGTQPGAFYGQNKDIQLNLEVFMAGFTDAYQGKEQKISQERSNEIMQAFQARMMEAQQQKSSQEAALNAAQASKVLAENLKNKDVQQTGSGLQFQVLKEGTGKQPKATDKVRVHYTGTLVDGTVFDSSRERGQDITFGLNQVIRGWTEGLQLMKEGSIYRFWIPAELGYGNQATGSIPAGSLLIFEVELFEVIPQ
jgi:FKBP-type peptidyl-prolyl cis-trans isomerase